MLRTANMRKQSGYTIIEIMITVAIAGVLFTLALGAMQDMMAGTRTKATAETILGGLRKAKSEAIKRNMPMRFQLVSSVSNACSYSTSSMAWVITESDQSTYTCGGAAILFKSQGEPQPTVTVSSNGASIVTFSPLGLILDNMNGDPQLTQIDVTSSNAEATPWRVLVSSGGSIKVCNAGTGIAATDPFKCP